MAKRRRRNSSGFWDGFNESYSGTRQIAQDIELANANEKPESVSGFSEDQGKELNTLGANEDNDITYDAAKGDYVVTSKATGEARRISPGQRTILYGKDHGRQLSDDEIKAERTSRQASIYSKYGNPEKAMMLEQRAQQGKMGDLQIKAAQRQDKQAEADDRYKAGLPKLYEQSNYAQIQRDNTAAEQDYAARKADYDAKVQAGVPPQQLGTPPQRPAKQSYGIGHSLADTAAGYAYDAQNGRFDHKQWIGLAEKLDKVESEGYEKALRHAEGGAPIDTVAAEFNKSGAIQFDPKNVISDRVGKTKIRGVEVDTRFITYKDVKGNERTINTTAELAAIQGTKDILTTQFAIKKDQRDGQQLGLQGRQVGLAEGKDKRDQDEKEKAAEAAVNLFKQNNPNATAAEIEAKRRGVMSEKGNSNNIKATDGLTRLGEMYGTKNALGEFQFSKDAKGKYLKATIEYERLIKSGYSPMEAVGLAYEAGGRGASAATPKSDADFEALQSGAIYIDPQDGKRYRKP